MEQFFLLGQKLKIEKSENSANCVGKEKWKEIKMPILIILVPGKPLLRQFQSDLTLYNPRDIAFTYGCLQAIVRSRTKGGTEKEDNTKTK